MWYGLEKEDSSSIKTLFIDDVKVTSNEIQNACKKHCIKRIYLGANRTYCDNILDLDEFLNFVNEQKIELVYETTIKKITKINKKILKIAKIILTINVKECVLKNVNVLKLDTLKNVYTNNLKNFYKTSLKTLNSKGMYSTDKEI